MGNNRQANVCEKNAEQGSDDTIMIDYHSDTLSRVTLKEEGVKQSMFLCKACGSGEFELMLHPDFAGSVDVQLNEHQDVLIVATVNGAEQQFVADLMFMNQFALCKQCKATKQWQYHYKP